jgi:O-antigen/teichoic acid export membrane protein
VSPAVVRAEARRSAHPRRPRLVARYAEWRSNPDLNRKASLNAVAAGLDYLARSLVELILNPLLVAGLGTYLYGAWRILWRLTGYIWASSGRSAQALQWAIANKQHVADDEEKRRHVGSAIAVWFIFSPLLGTLGAIGVWLAPQLLRSPARYVADIRLAAALLVADAIVLTLLTLPRAVLQGENLGYKRMGLSMLLVLLQGGLTAGALALHTGLVGVAVANIAGTLVTGATFVVVARHYVPWFGASRPSRPMVKWFFGLSWWFTGWKVLMQLMTGGDIVVLGFFGSVSLVTVYALSKFVPEAVAALVATLVQAMAPGLGGIIGAGKHARAVRVRAELMMLTWVVVTVAGAGVLLWNASFLGLWIDERFYPGTLPTLAIVVAAMQFIVIRNDASVIDLTLKLKPKVLIGLASTGLALGLAAVFVGPLHGGITGLCLGLVAGRSILSVAYPWLVGRAIGQSLASQARGAARPAIVTAVLFAAAAALGRVVEVHTWIAFVLGVLGSAAGLAVVAVTLGLTGEQRRGLIRRARLLLPSRGSAPRGDGGPSGRAAPTAGATVEDEPELGPAGGDAGGAMWR